MRAVSRPRCFVGAALLTTLLVGCTTPAETPPLPALEVRQEKLDDDQRIPVVVARTVGRVVRDNQSLLGAPSLDFCGGMSRDERLECIAEVDSITTAEIGDVIDLEENSDLGDGGREWPNAEAVAEFRRLRLSVALHKGERTAHAEATILLFTSDRAGEKELCAFPLEHWTWSAMDRPERFNQTPVGVCGERELTVSEYLFEQKPDATFLLLRFLSEAEARAWASGEAEKIKWDSTYAPGHPYAKYFLLDSDRWWRGGTPARRREGYGWAVRIDDLPLARIRELEENGDVFLDVYEDGAQIEFTNLTKDGLVALLAEKPSVWVDTSGPGDSEPRFEPFAN